MRYRYFASVGALSAILALILLVAVSMPGQNRGTARPGAAPRTAWGTPDLQGAWFVLESVPLERSAANAGKELLTDAEVAALDKQKAGDPGRNARASGAQDVT